jgi:elongator complex protein 1
LTSKKRYAEAGQILLDYAGDVREAIIALVQGNQFSEARRIVSLQFLVSIMPMRSIQIALHELPGLIEDIIDPAVLEARAQISEDLTEMREQLQKQVSRLRELRIKKVEQPGKCP